ncbi:MAG: aspartyl protease family protein [Chloroflexi bacterium]|nr:aspartyl protease family protein [Chloroflexota bacterium]
MTKRIVVSLFLAAVIAVVSWLLLVPAGRIPDGSGENILGNLENIILFTPVGEVTVTARIDTGAETSSIDIDFARSIGLEPTGNKVRIITTEGVEERDTVRLTFMLADRSISVTGTLADRARLVTNMNIGRDALAGFIVDPSQEFLSRPKRMTAVIFFPFAGPGVAGGRLGIRDIVTLVPIMASLVVVVRLLIGLRSYGIFAPVIIALSLLTTDIVPGIFIYASLLAVGIGVKLLVLNHLRLPNIAELAVIMFVLVLALLGISALPINLPVSFADVFFPLIVTTLLIEQISRTAEEHRFIEALPLLIATFALAIILFAYGSFLLEQSPEMLLVVFMASVLAVIGAGNYVGLRLTELVRFKFLRRGHVHK